MKRNDELILSIAKCIQQHLQEYVTVTALYTILNNEYNDMEVHAVVLDGYLHMMEDVGMVKEKISETVVVPEMREYRLTWSGHNFLQMADMMGQQKAMAEAARDGGTKVRGH